jgi:hypothetical protein
MPWLAACPDPFEGLTFDESYGEVIYPAVAAVSANSSTSHSPETAIVPSQPHPIHRLIRDAETAWHAKVSRQSKSLEEAVAEYRRRHKMAPPKGFDAWYKFAVANNVSLIDEYDSINGTSLLFLDGNRRDGGDFFRAEFSLTCSSLLSLLPSTSLPLLLLCRPLSHSS